MYLGIYWPQAFRLQRAGWLVEQPLSIARGPRCGEPPRPDDHAARQSIAARVDGGSCSPASFTLDAVPVTTRGEPTGSLCLPSGAVLVRRATNPWVALIRKRHVGCRGCSAPI